MSDLWITTAHGAEHHIAGIEATRNEHSIDVIAHACAQINRFTGHTARPYSVAEHQLLCADIAAHLGLPPVVQLACLVHDAHEAYVGDMASPLKWAVGAAWEQIEQQHARDLRRWLGLHSVFTAHRGAIKQIDLMALATERRDLLPWTADTHAPWSILDTPGRVVPTYEHTSLSTDKRAHTHWSEWRDQYLERYHALRETANRGVLRAVAHAHEEHA